MGDGAWTVVPVSNPWLESKYLKKDTVLGKVFTSEAVMPTGHVSIKGDPSPTILSDGLEKMISETYLADRRDLDSLRRLVEKYQDAWQVEGEPLGRTDKVLHFINTGDAQPFKMPYRRLQLGKKRVVEE